MASIIQVHCRRVGGGRPQNIGASTPRNAILAHIKASEGSNPKSEVTDPETK